MNPLVMAVFGGTVTFTLLAIVFFVVRRSSRTSTRLFESLGGEIGTSVPSGGVATDNYPRPDPFPGLSEALEETRWWQDLQLLVLRAGLLLRPSEALAIAAVTAAVGIAIGWFLTHELLVALIAGTLALGGLYVYLTHLVARRQAALSTQLPNALDMLSSGLRSGHSLNRSLRIVATQSRPPLADEAHHVLQDIAVGVSTSDAFDLLVTRTNCYDLELVVAAIQTHLKLGGNLAEVLDNISGVIRERVRLQREIDAATSEGRLSASILVALPFVMAILVSIINPGYLEPLIVDQAGRILLIGAGVLMVIGIIVLKNMVEIDF